MDGACSWGRASTTACAKDTGSTFTSSRRCPENTVPDVQAPVLSAPLMGRLSPIPDYSVILPCEEQRACATADWPCGADMQPERSPVFRLSAVPAGLDSLLFTSEMTH